MRMKVKIGRGVLTTNSGKAPRVQSKATVVTGHKPKFENFATPNQATALREQYLAAGIIKPAA